MRSNCRDTDCINTDNVMKCSSNEYDRRIGTFSRLCSTESSPPLGWVRRILYITSVSLNINNQLTATEIQHLT